ncbi:VOC family protein, partial [Vibrio cholerae]|nr:VOC family protein [Vibrio cholerae]
MRLVGWCCKYRHNKRLKRDCQREAFPVPMSRGGYGC